jgi:uncharacterized Tic20 family protein
MSHDNNHFDSSAPTPGPIPHYAAAPGPRPPHYDAAAPAPSQAHDGTQAPDSVQGQANGPAAAASAPGGYGYGSPAYASAPGGYGAAAHGLAPTSAAAHYGAPARSQATGRIAWGLGFLAYIPIPIIGQLIGAIAMIATYPSLRRKGEVAQGNGRNAANWGITYIVLTIVLLGGALIAVLAGQQQGEPLPGWAVGIAGTLAGLWIFGLNIAHVILLIIGLVKAGSGQVFECRLALPFISRPRPELELPAEER